MKKNIIKYTVAAMGLFVSCLTTHAQTLITFDNIVPLGEATPFPNGYAGLNWNNFFVEDDSAPPTSGYTNGTVSPPNAAYNGFGDPASISSATPFTLNSAYLTGAWFNSLNVNVQGFVGNTLTYDNTYIVNATGPSFEQFNYAGVTSVTFTSSGGTYAGYASYGTNFVLDNMTITVPEPSTWAMMLGGLGLLAFRRLRTRRA